MANVIKLRKGLDINLKGKAVAKVSASSKSEVYGLVPDAFVGLKPKVVVKEGDVVKAGDALFVNKMHPEVKFVSPVSGQVVAVERGERRKVLSVQVKADKELAYTDFGKKQVSSLSKEQVKSALLESGLFAFILQRPYAVVADPNDNPKAIFVSSFSDMPLAADFEVALKGNEADFQTGVDALAKLAKVYLGVKPGASQSLMQARNAEVTVFDGKCPAGNVGVQINHVSPVNKGEVVWTVGAEEVIFIGRLFNQGRVDLSRVIAVAGSEVKSPEYVKVLVGQQIGSVVNGKLSTDKKVRIIDGNPLTGVKASAQSFLGAHSTEITVIPEGDDADEAFGWIMPRFNQFSTSRTYCSWLMGNKEYTLDARIKGGERHMIMSGEYDNVFPMDIYPEQLVKAIIAGDIDRMEALGVYEVAPEDFAVCEFVDSSKLELQRIVREGLDMLRKENE
ncbi:MAG: Na(+)-translocating NADH-quinone reductase subunit A [Bacteroides sp.]|nr:Na(+)-translocating NADH-quinone reductase subunit A [Roseburia sp.]MCM1345974.1 Na(+)-translocating NADH-quinone reductase subunit A [Bacteroides sp.]MCM1420911.1 Na(+)-translocating NADH-quinone reductase subunit A [Bacteroides sp.]